MGLVLFVLCKTYALDSINVPMMFQTSLGDITATNGSLDHTSSQQQQPQNCQMRLESSSQEFMVSQYISAFIIIFHL